MAVNKNVPAPASTSGKQESGPVLILTSCHNSHEFIERRIVVTKGEENGIKVGRAVGRVLASPNNAIFDCKVLSRNHATVWLEDDTFYIKDTKSSNGTFINNSRLSNSGEESPPTPLATGDILQLGVEIVDNTKKVASGCIIAMVRFLNSQGAEIATRRSASTNNSNENMITERIPKHCLVVPEEQMYQMQQYLYEAKHREAALGQKLTILQEALKEANEASETNWQAMINEERLLSRIEILESQIALVSTKNITNADLQRKIDEFYTEKERVETHTKDILRKSTEEASEARIRLQEVELALMNVEEQNNFIREQYQEAERALEIQKYEYEKLHSDYDIVCQELEIARAANQHLVLTIAKEKEDAATAAFALQNSNDQPQINGDFDNIKSDLITVTEDIIPPAPAPPSSNRFETIGIQVFPEELLIAEINGKKELMSLEDFLSPQIDNSIIEANKENFKNLTHSLNSLFTDSNSIKINPSSLHEAVANTIASITKKTHEIIEAKQKQITEEKMAKLNDLLTKHEINSNNIDGTTPTQIYNSKNNFNEFYNKKKLSTSKVESSEDILSVFPIFSLFVLFLYKIMQVSNVVYIKAVGYTTAKITDQNVKTGEDDNEKKKS